MNFHKTLGVILLCAGLLLVAGVLWQSYGIFIGNASAPAIFKNLSAPPEQDGNLQNMQDQVSSAVKKEIERILPAGSVAKVMNLASWSLFAFIFISAGGIVSSIGVKLMKQT